MFEILKFSLVYRSYFCSTSILYAVKVLPCFCLIWLIWSTDGTLLSSSGGGSTTIAPVHDGYVLQKVFVLLDLIRSQALWCGFFGFGFSAAGESFPSLVSIVSSVAAINSQPCEFWPALLSQHWCRSYSRIVDHTFNRRLWYQLQLEENFSLTAYWKAWRVKELK